jgi:cytochrome c biogenesis protein CcmG/thiol:disulfide interchange protein DsbE
MKKEKSVLKRTLKISIYPALGVVSLVLATPAVGQRFVAQQSASSPRTTAAGLLRKPAPNFEVRTLDGKPVFLEDYKGKTLIVNFWATWCGNCKLEMPWLAQLREKYAGQGFEVLGIVTDNAPVSKISALTQKYGVKYPILKCNHKTAQAYGGLPELPASFFIDRRGIIVAVMGGADSEQQIEANVQRALHGMKGH